MKRDEAEIYREALESVVSDHPLLILSGSRTTVTEIAFTAWRKAMHEIMILNQCRCLHHQPEKCFLALSKDKQIALYVCSEFCFYSFLETLVGIDILSVFSTSSVAVGAN